MDNGTAAALASVGFGCVDFVDTTDLPDTLEERYGHRLSIDAPNEDPNIRSSRPQLHDLCHTQIVNRFQSGKHAAVNDFHMLDDNLWVWLDT